MPLYMIATGEKVTILQNIAYALPARLVRILASAAIEQGLTSTGPWTALTAANTTGVEIVGGFIRCTTAACDIMIGE